MTGATPASMVAGPACSSEEQREIEAFLNREARLADESHYAEWEALVPDDMYYWVPAGPAEGGPAANLSYINDNRARPQPNLAFLL
ncbi:MAG: hypothetical protein OEW29_06780 [Acidimicrobiia bacterium]|nr:hypothetical protein [Acidimicrobiia bacterium]MDH4362567.1 hypothetical protein [Acidimicrobiia bacterium]